MRINRTWIFLPVLLSCLAAGCAQPVETQTPAPTGTAIVPVVVSTETTPTSLSEIDERLHRVENGLIPVTEDGQISWDEKHNIVERMEHYNVQGVSIAVINDYQIE